MSRVTVAIASPGDVNKERDAVHHVFSRWNSAHDYATLNASMWETSTVPELGGHPQQLINERIIKKSDLLVAILWSKIGTPTPTAQSGTVEEIREFIKHKGPARVMLYFCTRDLSHDTNPIELAKLQDFKAEIRRQGIYQEYKSVDEFSALLLAHIDVKVQELLTGKLPIPAPMIEPLAQETKSKEWVDPRLVSRIDFGSTLDQITNNFREKMRLFQSLGGGKDGKYLLYGSHVYDCAASSIDTYLTFGAAGLGPVHRTAIVEVSARLKRLAAAHKEYIHNFAAYWIKGAEIASDLANHRDHLQRIGKIT